MDRIASRGREAFILNLPVTPYEEAQDLQRSAVAARISGRLSADLIIIVEHPPVFTTGRRGGIENLTVDRSFLEEKGIAIQPIERGGDITYHGPGQLVVYPVVKIKAACTGVADYVAVLEEAMVRTAAQWRINGCGSLENRGAWVQDRKLGSIGITVRRGVAFHGLALNVNTEMAPFEWINPCGLKRCQMTSVAREVKRPVSMATARKQMKRHLTDLLKVNGLEVNLSFVRQFL